MKDRAPLEAALRLWRSTRLGKNITSITRPPEFVLSDSDIITLSRARLQDLANLDDLARLCNKHESWLEQWGADVFNIIRRSNATEPHAREVQEENVPLPAHNDSDSNSDASAGGRLAKRARLASGDSPRSVLTSRASNI